MAIMHQLKLETCCTCANTFNMKRITMFISVIIAVFLIMSFNLYNCNGCIVLTDYKPIAIVITFVSVVVMVIMLII